MCVCVFMFFLIFYSALRHYDTTNCHKCHIYNDVYYQSMMTLLIRYIMALRRPCFRYSTLTSLWSQGDEFKSFAPRHKMGHIDFTVLSQWLISHVIWRGNVGSNNVFEVHAVLSKFGWFRTTVPLRIALRWTTSGKLL